VWTTSFGRGFKPVVRQTAKWKCVVTFVCTRWIIKNARLKKSATSKRPQLMILKSIQLHFFNEIKGVETNVNYSNQL
jgi:hypothetical protein